MFRLTTFRNSLVIISITVLLILGSQVYRTINNYQLNKQRFINDVQLALDLSVEKYYADKARSHFALTSMRVGDSIQNEINSIVISGDSPRIKKQILITSDTSLKHTDTKGFQYAWSSNSEDVNVKKHIQKYDNTTRGSDTTKEFSFVFTDFTQLTQKIFLSTSEANLDIEKLREILAEELDRRSLSIGYAIIYESERMALKADSSLASYPLTTTSKSTYLMPGESLNLYFENAPMLILKKGAWDMILSIAIVLSVIGALYYLYAVIKNQKELALIKDDLIGNVTHEFKTPIATVSTALEAIANFNEANDPEKTKRYIQMSRDQLTKLNLMVEKLMETATIDSGEMEISRVDTNLSELAKNVVDQFRLQLNEKALNLRLPDEEIWSEVDPFHIENVLSNLIDNAIKYGGNEITVELQQKDRRTVIQVMDNGGQIEKTHQQRIFEKLYRIPKGNQHDVKGFGIGLYYTRAIVERHNGQITLDVSANRTCFTVTL